MNHNTRRMRRLVSYQTPTTVQAQDVDSTEETATSNVVRTTETGEVRKGTFSITVKDDAGKELYSNKAEEFEYDVVDSLQNALVYHGAKLSSEQVDFIGSALKSDDAETDKAIGGSVQDVVRIINAKLKADAKSSAYQALVNKYKPLEGEKKETAMARLVANFIKLAGVSKEAAIETLKAGKALPEDYTVADFDSTPLRRTKGEDSEE